MRWALIPLVLLCGCFEDTNQAAEDGSTGGPSVIRIARFDGVVDHVRISSVVRPAIWLEAANRGFEGELLFIVE